MPRNSSDLNNSIKMSREDSYSLWPKTDPKYKKKVSNLNKAARSIMREKKPKKNA